MISNEFDVMLEAWAPPTRSPRAEGKYRRHRTDQLKRAHVLSRLEVRRLTFRGVGLTRSELSERSGVAESTIAAGEAGKMLADSSWRRLALALTTPPETQASVWHVINPQAL